MEFPFVSSPALRSCLFGGASRGHNGISNLRLSLPAVNFDGRPCAKTMDHDEKNNVKHGLSECKGVVGHKTSRD